MVEKIFRSLLWPRTRIKNYFLSSDLLRFEKMIEDAEKGHVGEIKLCVEGALSLMELMSGKDCAKKADEIFCEERLWDTEWNSGVLIFVLLSENALELRFDRGVKPTVEQLESWVKRFEASAKDSLVEAICDLITSIGSFCNIALPQIEDRSDEVSNRPRVG